MKSTGEVMGVASDYPAAFGKAQAAAGAELPASGTVFISVTDGDKPAATQLAASLHDLGFRVLATGGTAQAIRRMGVPVERIKKLSEGSPNVVERIEAGEVALVINTPTGSGARADGYEIRRAAVARGIPCITTMSRRERRPARDPRQPQRGAEVISLQELHGDRRRRSGRRAAQPTRPARRVSRAAHARAAGAARGARDRESSALGAYHLITALRRERAAATRARASSTCWPRASAGAAGRTSAPTCRARSPSRARAAEPAGRARVPARGGRPRHRAPGRARPGEGLALVGPLGVGFGATRAAGTRPLLVGGGIGAAPLLCLQDELGAERSGAARLPLGRPRRGGGAVRRRARGRHRRRLGRAAGARHGPAARASSTAIRAATVYACGPPAMLEAVRALCAEPACPPSSRWSPAWRAASAPASAASSRPHG